MHKPRLHSPTTRVRLASRGARAGLLLALAAAAGLTVSAGPATAASTATGGVTPQHNHGHHDRVVGAAFHAHQQREGRLGARLGARCRRPPTASAELRHHRTRKRVRSRVARSAHADSGPQAPARGRCRLEPVTAFAVRGASLRRLGTVASGGHHPISVTAHGRLVYVLNDSGTPGTLPTVSGFRLTSAGLRRLPSSTRAVGRGGAGAAEVSFSPSGRDLVVTLKASNRIDVFPITAGGRPAAPVSTASLGTTPFGFAFDLRGHLVVSNATGGAAGLATVTGYRLRRSGALTPLSGPVALGQTAACWVVVSADGRHAYTANTGSGTISSLALGRHGQLALSNPVAGRTGGAPGRRRYQPPHGRLLYVLDSKTHRITGFRADSATGGLTSAGTRRPSLRPPWAWRPPREGGRARKAERPRPSGASHSLRKSNDR